MKNLTTPVDVAFAPDGSLAGEAESSGEIPAGGKQTFAQDFQVSGEPMFTQHCRFIGYRGVGMDITERMRRAA